MKIKRTLVLDLDECILHTPQKDKEGWKDEDFEKLFADFSLRSFYRKYKIFDPHSKKSCDCVTLFRPGFENFLCSIRKFFDIFVIWTAGSYGYATSLISNTFPRNNLCQPDIIWSREQQINTDIKPLRLLWEKHPEINPDFTFHIDNLDVNFAENPFHGILIPNFEPRNYEEFKNSKDNFLDRCLKYFASKRFLNPTKDQDLLFLWTEEEKKLYWKRIENEQRRMGEFRVR